MGTVLLSRVKVTVPMKASEDDCPHGNQKIRKQEREVIPHGICTGKSNPNGINASEKETDYGSSGA